MILMFLVENLQLTGKYKPESFFSLYVRCKELDVFKIMGIFWEFVGNSLGIILAKLQDFAPISNSNFFDDLQSNVKCYIKWEIDYERNILQLLPCSMSSCIEHCCFNRSQDRFF